MIFTNRDILAKLAALDRSQAVVEFGLDGTILTANTNFLETFGYALDEIVGRHHRLFVGPDERESAAYVAFWASLARGEYQTAEYKRYGKGGREVWIQGTYNPILNRRGRPIKVVKFATDITAQKLRNFDHDGKVAAISKSQGVIEFALDDTILTANANFLSAVGYGLDEVQGQHHRMFVDPDERASTAYREFWANLRRGAFHTAEFRRIGKHGREVWLQATYNPILDHAGTPLKVVKFATDITEEVAKRRQFQVLSLVADETDNSVVITDADGRIEYVNAGFARLTGYAASEVMGRKPGVILQGPQTSEGTRARVREKLARRQPFYDEILNYTKAGAPYWISLSINPIFDEDGALSRFVSIQTDVTKRKAAEDELARRNEELQAARTRADDANAAKSRFLAIMSHELRTPMTGVIGLSDLVLSDDDNPLPPESRQRIKQLRASADQLLALLNDILDLSKIEAGELTVETIAFDPVASVREVIELLGPLAQANGNRLVFETAADDWRPQRRLGDPTRVRQVLFNIIGNANKFTRDGCITIAMCDEEPGDGAAASLLRFTVRDTGTGMSAAQIATLYTPFVQGDASTTRKYGGTGLGLAICKRLVEAMGGAIAVESAPGAGTSLSFTVRADRADLAPMADARLALAARRLSLNDAPVSNILLVEDTEITRDIIAAMLRRAGHTVVEVADGALALDAIRATAFDLVLMDMQMPVMDGPSATRAIRALPDAFCRVPILGLTADALPEHQAAHMTSGLDGYVTKPINWAQLAEAIVRCRPDAPLRPREREVPALAPKPSDRPSDYRLRCRA